MVARAIWALLLVLAAASTSSADPLLVFGVAVGKDGRRIAGGVVRLYATSSPIGRALAEDRTSDRGIFRLYRPNVSGDLGDLYVTYEGSDGTAEPLKVSIKTAQQGIYEARTGDLIVLQVPDSASLTSDEAAEQVAALTKTQAVLVQAGVKSESVAEAELKTRTTSVLAHVTVEDRRNLVNVERHTAIEMRGSELGRGTLDFGVAIRDAVRDSAKSVKPPG